MDCKIGFLVPKIPRVDINFVHVGTRMSPQPPPSDKESDLAYLAPVLYYDAYRDVWRQSKKSDTRVKSAERPVNERYTHSNCVFVFLRIQMEIKCVFLVLDDTLTI